MPFFSGESLLGSTLGRATGDYLDVPYCLKMVIYKFRKKRSRRKCPNFNVRVKVDGAFWGVMGPAK